MKVVDDFPDTQFTMQLFCCLLEGTAYLLASAVSTAFLVHMSYFLVHIQLLWTGVNVTYMMNGWMNWG